jgi:hypothetical protein
MIRFLVGGEVESTKLHHGAGAGQLLENAKQRSL